MRRRSVLALVTPLAVIAALSAAACEEEGTPMPCTDVPAGGCPLAHGVSCLDPACEAVYACLPGNRWELRERCPARAPGDGGGDDRDASADASAPFDAAIDAPPGAFGGPGCAALLTPDCPLGVALACGSGCCDCEDLFVCESGGWDFWGTCTPEGLVPAP